MADLSCRFCRASADQQFIKGRNVYGGRPHQHFWQCRVCDIIYLDPPLSQEEEEKFYKEEFEKYMAQRAGRDMDWSGPQKHVQSNQPEMKRRVSFLEPYLKRGQGVLEVGCSSGFMLSALKERGLEVYGLDPSGGFMEYVRSQGIKVFNNLEEMRQESDARFDLIIHYYVLEHIRHPVEFLQEYLSLLKPTGTMIFEVPCACDPLVELYQVPAFDNFYWSVAHHWYFNPSSLAGILKKVNCSFKLFPEQRYDLSNHLVWMLEGKPGGRSRYHHIFGDQLDAVYKEQLKKNWFCDTIVAVVKNP